MMPAWRLLSISPTNAYGTGRIAVQRLRHTTAIAAFRQTFGGARWSDGRAMLLSRKSALRGIDIYPLTYFNVWAVVVEDVGEGMRWLIQDATRHLASTELHETYQCWNPFTPSSRPTISIRCVRWPDNHPSRES